MVQINWGSCDHIFFGGCQLESCEWVLWIEIHSVLGKLLTWLEVVDLEFKTWVDIAISITNTSALLTGFC